MRSNLRIRRAFTLIELLVVIAIISLLVSILLPSLNKAKDLARSTVCMTQIRSLGTGFVFYQQDFGGVLPPADDRDDDGRNGTRFGGTVNWWGPTWNEYLCKTYLNDYPSRKMVVCPGRPSNWTNTPAGYWVDYGMNPYVSAWTYGVLSYIGTPLQTYGWKSPLQMEQPSSIVLVADSCWDPADTVHCYINPTNGYYHIPHYGRVHLRHTGEAANTLYVDGHVENVRTSYADSGQEDFPFASEHFRQVP